MPIIGSLSTGAASDGVDERGLQMTTAPSYRVHFEPDDHTGALACLSQYGYCVVRGMIGPALVEELKDSIDEHLDPDGTLPPASNRYHMAFAEVSEPVWKLVDLPPYWNFICAVLGSSDVCLHRSAAILRTPGEGMGAWHTDHLGHVKEKIEKSHHPGWQSEGFEFLQDMESEVNGRYIAEEAGKAVFATRPLQERVCDEFR